MMRLEIAPTLKGIPDSGLEEYRRRFLARIANPALPHPTSQVAMDGSQKVPQRLLDTIRDRLRTGDDIQRLTLAVAAWLHYLRGEDESGGRYKIPEPMGPRLAKRGARADGAARAAAPSQAAHRRAMVLSGFKPVFGDLGGASEFVSLLAAHLETLLDAVEWEHWGQDCLRAQGFTDEDARCLAESLAQTSLWGIDSHGIARLPHYLNRVAHGAILARPEIRIERTGPGTAQLHGDQGQGIVVAHRANALAMELARDAGIAAPQGGCARPDRHRLHAFRFDRRAFWGPSGILRHQSHFAGVPARRRRTAMPGYGHHGHPLEPRHARRARRRDAAARRGGGCARA
ncbi:hypothetical protein G6F31_013962 [Rhizopus arrhizus]|nr:hypothetical protein G6F31_013962 [Rhizopus arrhizus]